MFSALKKQCVEDVAQLLWQWAHPATTQDAPAAPATSPAPAAPAPEPTEDGT
jgi:GTP-binding protein